MPMSSATVPPSISHPSNRPIVTVVIPTCNRPELLRRAITSVLGQTLHNIEVIVVINGPDAVTWEAIHPWLAKEPRLQLHQIPEAGASLARNAGVDKARSPWIALLDDDDEWMPEKLVQQLAWAEKSPYALPIVGCRLLVRTPQGDLVRPRRFRGLMEPVSEYILTRRGLFHSEGLVQSSMIFTRRELLLRVPFPHLPKHQDWTWLLQAMQVPGCGLEFVPDCLAVWYLEDARSSVSRTMNWRNSLNWIREYRGLVTKRAFAGFVLVEVAAQAATQGDWRAFGTLLWAAIREGSPRPIDGFLYLGMWLVPPGLRRQIRTWLTRSPAAT
jgi:glycosyltransferase involved in cell wall biosynthesis